MENANTIKGQSDRITTIIRQLLDFARPVSSLLQATDLCEVLENTLFLLKSKIDEKNINVEKNIKQHPLMIMADGEQLRQVFLNIIINALQWMDKGGVLRVVIRARKARDFGHTVLQSYGSSKGHILRGCDCAVVGISDNGRGIDPEDLPHLFDPFFSGVGNT